MSDAVKIIDQEIDQVSQMLKHHAYQLQVLKNLREKMSSVSGQLIMEESSPEEKRSYEKTTNDETLKMAKRIARLIRKEGGTKEGHLRAMWRDGKLTYSKKRALLTKMYPSQMGRELHDKIFKGTKYAK